MYDLKPLVVKRQAAEAAIGAGSTKLTQLIATGEIEAVKSGKSLLVIVESLERYIARLPPAKLKPDGSYTKKPA